MNSNRHFWSSLQDGTPIFKYILRNKHGMEVEFSNFGALILAIRLPIQGELRDVTLGFDDLQSYYDNNAGFGAYIGRNANRIAGAKVVLDGICYHLEQNDHGNNLHSGSCRSHYQVYHTELGEDSGCGWVEFSRLSPHLEQGFPGNLEQQIRYSVTNDNELIIDYSMMSDHTTVINPTNHCYFNLDGHSSGTILHHRLMIPSGKFLPTGDDLVPTGEVRAVTKTPFDFRRMKEIGEAIDSDYLPLKQAGGYDHNYCFPNDRHIKQMALLESSDGSVSMKVSSDQCGVQLYSGNFLDGITGKSGAVYQKRAGLCLETQFYPDACNHKEFPSSIAGSRQRFNSKTIYQFRWDQGF